MKKHILLLAISALFWACNSSHSGEQTEAPAGEVRQQAPELSPAPQPQKTAGDTLYRADSLKITWTAYKTTAKVPVSGTFTAVEFHLNPKAYSAWDLFRNASARIQTASVFSGNQSRDALLRDAFFQMMMETNLIEARFRQADPRQGTLQMVIRMNNREVPVTFTVIRKDGILSGDADIDVVKQFKAGRALYNLHTSCEKQHTGKDGISKTWPDVHLHFDLYYHSRKS